MLCGGPGVNSGSPVVAVYMGCPLARLCDDPRGIMWIIKIPQLVGGLVTGPLECSYKAQHIKIYRLPTHEHIQPAEACICLWMQPSLYPLIQQVGRGVYWFHLVRLSVRPSVCLSICGWNRVRSVSSTILARSISYLHILSSIVRRCVIVIFFLAWKKLKFGEIL